MPKPKRYFNVAGPCVPGDHYMLDPLRGIGGELMDLMPAETPAAKRWPARGALTCAWNTADLSIP